MSAANQPIPVEATTLPRPKDLAEVLTRLDAWYARHLPAVHATLRPPATDTQLDALEHKTGLKLPADFRALYRWHDGQNWNVGGVLGLDFLSLGRLESDWDVWQDIAENDPQMNLEIAIRSHPTGAIREQYASAGSLPFLSDGGGNFVGVDFWPDAAGKVGQVITSGRDEEDRYVLAPDLETFLRTYLERLETGRVRVQKLAGYEGEMYSARLMGEDGQAYETYGKLADLYPAFGAAPKNRRAYSDGDQPPEKLSAYLNRIETWLRAHHPDLLAALSAGATPAQLDAAEARLGRPLPEEVAYLYSRHANWGEVFGLPFIPIDQLGTQDPARFGLPDAEGLVVPFSPYRDPSGPQDWLPLWMLSGNYVGLNTARYGEVRTFGPSAKPRYLLAENLWLLLDRFTRLLEAGLVRREGNRLVLPDAAGKYTVQSVADAWAGFGLAPAVRQGH